MKYLLTVCLLSFFLGLSSSAQGYEDKPFEFEAVVPDSVLLVIRGVEYREFKLTYSPEDYELYINGNPIFGLGQNTDQAECAKKFVGVESALEKNRNGIPCEIITRWYNSEKNVVLWAGAWLIQSGETKGKSDIRLTVEFLRICHRSPIAQDIKWACVVNGIGYVEFEGIRYSSRRVSRVYSVEDWDRIGTSYLPFGEMVRRFSKDLVKDATSVGGSSKIIALGPGGGGMYGSGDGLVSRGRAQLAKIEKQGEYVKGPIPPNTFR